MFAADSAFWRRKKPLRVPEDDDDDTDDVDIDADDDETMVVRVVEAIMDSALLLIWGARRPEVPASSIFGRRMQWAARRVSASLAWPGRTRRTGLGRIQDERKERKRHAQHIYCAPGKARAV